MKTFRVVNNIWVESCDKAIVIVMPRARSLGWPAHRHHAHYHTHHPASELSQGNEAAAQPEGELCQAAV